MMEAEREALPDDDNEVTSDHMEIATLLEKSILLIVQAFNVITYGTGLIIFNTLIDNSIRVIKILKGRSLYLDDTEDPHFFGERFEEELIKIIRLNKNHNQFSPAYNKENELFFRGQTTTNPFYETLYQETNKEEIQVVEGEDSSSQEQEQLDL